MHKSATKCNETISKWCKNKHGASKIIDTFKTYQPSIPSPHSITDTPEIPPRPMTNVHADANAEHARRCGHSHAAPLCWTPQTTARSFPSPPHSLAPIYTRQKGETLVFSTLLAFVSDTVSQSVEVVVDVLDHFFSSLHG